MGNSKYNDYLYNIAEKDYVKIIKPTIIRVRRDNVKRYYYGPKGDFDKTISVESNNDSKKDYKNFKRFVAFVLCASAIAGAIAHFTKCEPVDAGVLPEPYIGYEENVGEFEANDVESYTNDFVVEEPNSVVTPEPVLENVIDNNYEEVVEQENEKKYFRTTTKVNIRSNCDSSNNDSVLETLQPGVVLEFSKDLNNGWYEVIYNNRYVYINASYVEEVTIKTNQDGKVVIINGSDVNIRKEATTSSTSLGTMQAGDCFTYVDTMPNGWYKIDYNGKTGYVSNAFSCLETAGLKYESVTTVTSTGNNLNVRDQASTNGRVIYRLNKGDTLQYTEKLVNGWYEVLINGHPGYVSGKYVKEGTRVMITNKSYAIVAAERDTVIYSDVQFTNPVAKMPQYETGYVYEAGGDYYLINAEQGTGYIKKKDARRLDDVNVVTDESDQITMAFRNGAPFFYVDCTTGAPGSETEKGIHQIRAILYKYHMEKWNVTVCVYMPFCRDQAFHGIIDVEGNKDIASEVGASVKETKRSHGCVREYDKDVLYLAENVEVGTDVVVKR